MLEDSNLNYPLYLLDRTYEWVWGIPLIVGLVLVGLYLTILLRGWQFRYLWHGLKLTFHPPKESGNAQGDISHFQALMTSLASTIGIGNIAGVATSITIGGLGALFWIWVISLVGMATKFAEAILAVKYRIADKNGEMAGGPMYYLSNALGWKKLACAFSLFGILSACGGGNLIQANSVADALNDQLCIAPWISAVVLMVIVSATLFGGISSIGRLAGIIVPFMALFYLGGGCFILYRYADQIPEVFQSIWHSAWHGQAATGGFIGSTLTLAMRSGISRGLMCSEAGMGTGAIAAAAARTNVPGRQAIIAMTGTFLGTFCLCSITGLVLGVTGVIGETTADGKLLNGAPMTLAAFSRALPGGEHIVTVGLVLFAFTTIIGSAYYAEKHFEYLLGERVIPFFRLLFVLIIFPGATAELTIVWRIADIANGLMTIPNIVGLVALGGAIRGEALSYERSLTKNSDRKHRETLLSSGS